ARADTPRLGQRRVRPRQPLLSINVEARRLLAVALDPRDALGAHAQVRLPEEARQDEQREEKNPELNEQRSVDVDELRLMRLGSRLQKQGQRGFHAQKPAARLPNRRTFVNHGSYYF